MSREINHLVRLIGVINDLFRLVGVRSNPLFVLAGSEALVGNSRCRFNIFAISSSQVSLILLSRKSVGLFFISRLKVVFFVISESGVKLCSY